MADNKILLNCEIEDLKPSRVNKSVIQTVVSILSVVIAFVILCTVASQAKTKNNPSEDNVHQVAAAGYEKEVYFF